MTMTNAQRQKAYRERKKQKARNEKTLQIKQFAQQIIKRPALRYHGGKWLLAEWIIDFFPRHDCYVEPFAGAANVLLRKKPAVHEVYNDLNSEVVNFFHCLREYPDELIRVINLTPYSRQEWEQAWEYHPEPIERARRFYVRSWQSYGSPTSETSSATGWRNQKSKGTASALRGHHDTARLWDVAARLLAVQIENEDAAAVIKRYDTRNTLFYVDPPYVFSTRSDWSGRAYQGEMSDEDHIKLSTVLKSVEGMVVLSGYDSDLYRRLYTGWDVVKRESRDITGGTQTEFLWLSPGVYDTAKLPLFSQTRF